MPSAITRVMGEGFRVFFLFAGLYGVFAGLAWGGWLATLAGLELWTEAPYAMSPPMWHAHEMIFGYASAALGGFFLTAVPNWTGAPPLTGWPLAGLALLTPILDRVLPARRFEWASKKETPDDPQAPRGGLRPRPHIVRA